MSEALLASSSPLPPNNSLQVCGVEEKGNCVKYATSKRVHALSPKITTASETFAPLHKGARVSELGGDKGCDMAAIYLNDSNVHSSITVKSLCYNYFG